MKLSVKEIAVFGITGALMFASRLAMSILPNMHVLGVFVVSLTVVYRVKALFPIYAYVFLEGLFSGFALWWVPYLYMWGLLWAGAMLLPKNMPKKIKPFVYMTLSALHGFLFGILYTPAQMLLFGMNLDMAIKWTIVGFPYDIIHGVSNFCFGMLIYPFISLLNRLKKL